MHAVGTQQPPPPPPRQHPPPRPLPHRRAPLRHHPVPLERRADRRGPLALATTTATTTTATAGTGTAGTGTAGTGTATTTTGTVTAIVSGGWWLPWLEQRAEAKQRTC